MRIYISTILILVILFNIGGYYLIFCAKQYIIQREIKQEIRKGLKDEDLSLIIVSNNDETGMCWTEPNKEFEYKGEMYDVVRIKINNQKRYYYCINDVKEKKLIVDFYKNHSSKKEEKNIKRTLNDTYFAQQYYLMSHIIASDFHFKFDFLYKSNFVEDLTPPPKSA